MKIIESQTLAQGYLICRFNQCMLIDPPNNIEQIEDYLEQRELIGILITHAHFKHLSMIHYYDVPIYIHHHDAHLLFEDKYNGYYHKKREYKKSDLNLKILKDQDEINLADQKIICLSTPGHTKGSMVFSYQDYLFTGDTLLKENVGSYEKYSGNLFELKNSVLMIMKRFSKDTIVCPGHGEITTIGHELKNNKHYRKWKR
ncbi:MAG: MBL fold metallo-hydrolase [Candidatus Phytoplasma sp.]|nr:MBL fold metallo-hydrolase [Phytoplasma sp.]